VRSSLLQLLNMLQEADRLPTTQAAAQVPKLHQAATAVIQQWNSFESRQLAPLHAEP